ncbi:MAG: succinate dehydrogenase assembly factor 2 [Deltaproteobacteria bacterium]|nr:succinate dehydrogenase assembly factor 2 [Deltaproteobacteria bacterium]
MDELALWRRKLRLRAAKRGFLEVELFLRPFVADGLTGLGRDELIQFERLIDLEDLDLWEVILGRTAPPPGVAAELLERIRRAGRAGKGAI